VILFDMFVKSETSDFNSFVTFMFSAADPEEPHEMGDPEKMDMTEEEGDLFDEKRSEAMAAVSDADW
jgi:hypothetical protein